MKCGHWLNAAAICITAICAAALADEPGKPQAAAPPATDKPDKAQKPKVLVTISKETTYITEPLRPDGYVDYVKALNDRYSKGVTPENNAAVLFWKAVGPGPIKPAKRDQFFNSLGMTPLPTYGEYFIPFDAYVVEQRKFLKAKGVTPNENEISASKEVLELDKVRPWSRKELPTLADWLKANKKALDLLIEASKRTRRFEPIIVSDNESPYILPTQEQDSAREVAYALISRALFQMDSGKIDAAWENLLATHRLARLIAQGPTLIELGKALFMEQIADAGDQALLQHLRPTSVQANRLRDDLRGLPPFPELAGIFDGTERFVYLGAVASLARAKWKESARIISGTGERSVIPPWIDRSHLPSVDWDFVLRIGNEWYDRMSKALREPTRPSRAAAWQVVRHDADVSIKKMGDKVAFAIDALSGMREAISRRAGLALLAKLMSVNFASAEDRATMRLEITKLGFAMAAYHADHTAYPAKLADLVPKYASELPKDVFNDGELHYKQQGDGYLIYSVGPNGEDDGGKGMDDAKNGDAWDDISLTVLGSKGAEGKP